MSDNIQDIVDALADAVGERFLGYALGLKSLSQFTAVLTHHQTLNTQQRQVAGLLRQIVSTDFVLAAPPSARNDLIRGILVQQSVDGTPLARVLRSEAGATEAPIATNDSLGRAISRLALDCYPAFLLPPRKDLRIPFRTNIEATSLIFKHPASKEFADAVSRTATLAPLFVEQENAGLVTWVWRNTGSGGTLQLWMLPELILNAAWRHILDPGLSAEEFSAQAIAQLQIVRNLLEGKSQESTATYAFTGILLPAELARVELAGSVLESVTENDRELAPDVLKQQITHAGPSGEVTTANYDGDVVLRMSFPLKVRTERPPAPGEMNMWPEDLQLPSTLDRAVERLRLSLLLGVQRESAAQLLPTWRYFDDPLGHGMAASWFDPRNAVGFVPIRLTAEEVESVRHRYRALSHRRLDKIGVAIRRIIKAASERREPADVLIDSVIAWENIFGTSEGEPTLRVTAALSILLESDLDKRETLRRELNAVYKLRSKVVHGSSELSTGDGRLCQVALDTALRTLRVLAEERVDVLEKSDGGERSLYLILRG